MEVTKELPEMKILAKQAKVSIYLMVFVFGGIFGFIYEELLKSQSKITEKQHIENIKKNKINK